MRPLWLVLPTAALACSAGSQPNDPVCNGGGTVTVDVTDQMSMMPVCDASVTLTPLVDGGAPQSLAASGPATGCHYDLTHVQPGTYTVKASKSGFNDATVTINVTQTGCSVGSPYTSLTLNPSK